MAAETTTMAAETTTMAAETTTMAAALLMRSDADIDAQRFFFFHVGSDAEATAATLSSGHYFTVAVALTAPNPANGAAKSRFEGLAAEAGATSLGQGWWTGVPLEAMAGAFARACFTVGTSGGPRIPDAPVSDPVLSQDTAAGRELGLDTDLAAPESLSEEIWAHVETCPPGEADKAMVIRATLEERLGKPKAKQLLACAHGCVAKDETGHANKILKVGKLGLRLRG